VFARVEAVIAGQRRRRPWFDHLARAGGRYERMQGDLMAAGVTYFAFLGLFPVLLLAASVIGLVLSGNSALEQQLFAAVREAFPGALGDKLVEQLTHAIDAAGVVGLIGLIGFLYAGLRTMDKLRIGMERIWKGHVDEPDLLRDNLQDLVALVALGAVGLASLGITASVTHATARVLRTFGLAEQPGFGVLTWVLGIALAAVVDVLVFLWLLRVVPSVSYPLRRLLPGALFGAAGFEVLKLVGGYYLSLISGSVTVSALGGGVGLLVWINVVARFAFFTAAWTATLPAITAASAPPGTAIPGPPGPAEVDLPERPHPSPLRVAAGLLAGGIVLGAVATRWLLRRR
jgi:membrane protein